VTSVTAKNTNSELYSKETKDKIVDNL